jgi:hypothetical protein
MVALTSLLFVLIVSLIIVRIATVALTLTGLSRQSAKFQARSAWTGTGFTTAESESVTKHPVRRRIISWLILLRSVGVVTAGSTLILSFVNVEDAEHGLMRFIWLIGGLVLLWMIWSSEWLDREMSRIISWALKRYTDIDTRDYAGLMHLAGEYAIAEFPVEEGDWLASKSLAELRLPDEGVVVLGIEHPDGTYIGAPRGSSVAVPGDTLLLYGRSPELSALDRRRADYAGEIDRRHAVAEQQRVRKKEEAGATGASSSRADGKAIERINAGKGARGE